jgi:transcriptional regulator with XRE-family HTH domain
MTTSIKSKPQLIVERSEGQLWGRTKIKGNLIVARARNLESLKKKLIGLAADIEDVEVNDFQLCYDLTSFFEEYAYLNITEIATQAGISPAMMRQYSSGRKFPSADRLSQIEKAIHNIGRQLSKVRLRRRQKDTA